MIPLRVTDNKGNVRMFNPARIDTIGLERHSGDNSPNVTVRIGDHWWVVRESMEEIARRLELIENIQTGLSQGDDVWNTQLPEPEAEGQAL